MGAVVWIWRDLVGVEFACETAERWVSVDYFADQVRVVDCAEPFGE